MQIQIHARNLTVDQKLQDYVEKKLNKLDKYLPNIAEVHVDLAIEHQHRGGERAIAQLTVRNERGAILRAEDKRETEILAAVDMAVDKMYRQISQYKSKRRRQGGDRFEVADPELAGLEALPAVSDDGDLEDAAEIIRRKRVDMMPMSEEEAVEQISLLDHDFFMFYNVNTSKVNVLYRRENGGFGLLEANIS
ncbi:MAG: ribosome-associated translation inhibitor RaiA [Chloroflexota bacterium]